MIALYYDTELEVNVEAQQYLGLSGPMYYMGAIIYVNDTDWLVQYPNHKITAYSNDIFVQRFTAV